MRRQATNNNNAVMPLWWSGSLVVAYPDAEYKSPNKRIKTTPSPEIPDFPEVIWFVKPRDEGVPKSPFVTKSTQISPVYKTGKAKGTEPLFVPTSLSRLSTRDILKFLYEFVPKIRTDEGATLPEIKSASDEHGMGFTSIIWREITLVLTKKKLLQQRGATKIFYTLTSAGVDASVTNNTKQPEEQYVAEYVLKHTKRTSIDEPLQANPNGKLQVHRLHTDFSPL